MTPRRVLASLLLALVTADALVVTLSSPRNNAMLSMSFDNNEFRRTSRRDIIRKCWGSTTSRSRLSSIRKKTTLLRLGKNNNQDDNDNGNDDSSKQLKLSQFKSSIVSRIPPQVLSFLEQVWDKLASLVPSLKLAFFSFGAGMVITLGAILVPVYNQVESLAEPVTLFETILGDLERGYVDEVDTQKLFETGISAMLKSLDPYTEFEGKQQAVELSESIGGRYGGVGLVISGATPRDLEVLEQQQQQQSTRNDDDNNNNPEGDVASSSTSSSVEFKDDNNDDDDDDDQVSLQDKLEERKLLKLARERGIRVVSAFEGYAFDYGMRVGDKLLTIDNKEITPNTSVEQVRNLLRGEPGTDVTIQFQREGVTEVQTVTMPRTVVQIRDVKLATLMGKPQDGIGYIQVTGFATNTGQEVRQAIMGLQRATEVASNGERSLQGLILDLRGNPGGLLTSAVDVASLLVPKGSDIVSAKGRGFPGVLYRSRVDPILEPNTKLAVLVNGGTASAAEIVSGAVQDLDVGVIVGSDRTYGKGLVQNVEEMPFNTALKFTVAKYYTPSGRCIQGIKYSEGGLENGGRYKERKVAAKDRATFHTRLGREVKDGGGIEADYKVPAAKASALEVTLLRSGAMGEFAALWSKSHELTNNFKVDDKTYNEFQAFVNQKHKEGDIKLDALYKGPIRDLKEVLKQSGFKASSKELDQLQASIIREVQKDFEKYKTDLKEDLEQSILARYLPESMLIEQSLKTDKQVAAAVKLVSNGRQFDSLLAKGNAQQLDGVVGTLNTAVKQEDAGVRLNMKW